MNKFLWATKFPDECKQLPFEYLSQEEQELATKCIDKAELTEDEKKQLQQILANYRPFFKKYNSKVAEENVEATRTIVRTQSEFLRLLHDKERYRIDMNYYINGQKILLQMRIKPYTDKQYLEGIGTQMGLFRDLSREEKKLVAKVETKQPMTPEEQKMYQALSDKIMEKAYDFDNSLDMINEFLADRIEFINDTEKTFEENLEFWRQIDLNAKTSLFHEVRGRLKLTDTFQEELFPPVR